MAGSSVATTARAAAIRRVLRVSFGCLLGLAFFGSLGWIVFGWPLPFRLWITLAVVSAASLGAFAAFFLPHQMNERVKRGLTAGATCVAIIAALVAVPAFQDATKPTGGETATPSTTSPTTPESDPFTAALDFDYIACEGYKLQKSLLNQLPEGDDLNAQWVYDHGGASATGSGLLTVQGKSQDAVILRALRVVDFERAVPPPNTVDLQPCPPVGGETFIRYFDVVLSDPPKVIAHPAVLSDQKTGKVQEAAKFPFKVSNSDPELFELDFQGPPCLCTWRLALDWTSGERSGTKFLDHGFGKIRTDTTVEGRPAYTRRDDGTWDPPLPK